MAVFEVKVIIPVTVHADSQDEAKDMAIRKVVGMRKDISHGMLKVEEAKQTSMF